jgi:sugar phosphate isomerase/epimerase
VIRHGNISCRDIGYAGIGDEAGPGLDTQLGALARLGWDAIELRTVDGRHLADLDDRRFAEIATRVADAGVRVVCVDSRIGDWSRPITSPFEIDLAELYVLAKRCAALGTRFVRVMSYPDDGMPADEWRARVIGRMRVLADRAERAGVVLLHENCAGWAATDADRMVELLSAVDSPALGLLFDVGNGVAHGYRAREVLDRVAPHVAHVHVKDAVRVGATTVYTLPGRGEADVAGCLRTLLASGYRGHLSIEPHLAVRPHEGVTHDDGGTAFVAFGSALRDLVDTLPRTDPAVL